MTRHKPAFARRAMFHPKDKPAVGKQRWMRRLDRSDLVRIERILTDLKSHFQWPMPLSPLICESRLMDLTALLLAPEAGRVPPALPEIAQYKVDCALAWYAEHHRESPSVREVAHAIHLSAQQLRRFFWQVYNDSPKAVMRRLHPSRAAGR